MMDGLTDSQGHVVDFRNTIIIMTSNIGGTEIVTSKKNLGFVGEETHEREFKEMKDKVLEEVKRYSNPSL